MAKKQNINDHFIRIARQIQPIDGIKVLYKVTDEDVVLEYKYNGLSKEFIIKNLEISRNFWNSVNYLQTECEKWTRSI